MSKEEIREKIKKLSKNNTQKVYNFVLGWDPVGGISIFQEGIAYYSGLRKKIFEAIEQMDEKGIEQISNFLKDLKNNKDR